MGERRTVVADGGLGEKGRIRIKDRNGSKKVGAHPGNEGFGRKRVVQQSTTFRKT
jgi:hypothetical protein